MLAHLIELFEQGLALQNIAQQLRLPTELAIEAKRQYDRLVAVSGQPSLQERLAVAMQMFDGRVSQLEAQISEVASSAEAFKRQVSQELYPYLQPRQVQLGEDVAELRNEQRAFQRYVLKALAAHDAEFRNSWDSGPAGLGRMR